MAASSVSEAARDLMQSHAKNLPPNQQEEMLEEASIIQGSIWEYSDSQPWFLLGLHKNNPTATRRVLESLMHFHSSSSDNLLDHKRRGTITISEGQDVGSYWDSEGRRVASAGSSKRNNQGTEEASVESIQKFNDGMGKGDSSLAEELITSHQHFIGSRETKIVIKKTVEMIGDMSKSCELVFHAVRACGRFFTYPTPSIPSDNFEFGHVKGWIWLIHKGLSHFNHDKTDKQSLDLLLKVFRKEMSLLAKLVNACVSDLNDQMTGLSKLNQTIRKEAKVLKQKRKSIWKKQMTLYFKFIDDIKGKHHLLVDTQEDRFFPTDWIFEPHPSETKLQWDFFHFQWVNLRRDWIDAEFELRSDYSLHWIPYSSYPPHLQTEIITHMIHHVKALIEETYHFHKSYMNLSFDTQEVKFLKYVVHGISKLPRHRDSVEFITGITKKLFEDLAVLEKVFLEYVSNMEWIVGIIEPCYRTMNTWLADDLVLPLEFSARRPTTRRWICCGKCLNREMNFMELFGPPLQVVLLRSPISIEQLQRFFPEGQCLPGHSPLPSSAINSFGVSEGYASSIFDAGLGRDAPLPLHHPLPKYKKRREQTINIFDIRRLAEATAECVVQSSPGSDMDVDIEKYLALMEEVQKFLAVFSSIYGFMILDLKERVDVLESLIYNNLPEHYETLVKMLLFEAKKPVENIEKSGVKAFGRLLKIFQFVVVFLERVDNLEENELVYYASKAAYYKSYSRIHSWINQKSALFSMYSLPLKKEMFSSLFSEKERMQGIEKNVKDFIEKGHALVDFCENVFRNYNIIVQMLL